MDADKFNAWQLAQVGVAQNKYEKRFYRHINSLGRDVSILLGDLPSIDKFSKPKIDSLIAQIVSVSNSRYADAVTDFIADTAVLANYVAESERLGLGMTVSAKDLAVITARTPIAASGLLPIEHMQKLVDYNNKRLADLIRQNWALNTPIDEIGTLIIGTDKLRNQDGLIYKSKVAARAAIDTTLHGSAMVAKGETWKANKAYKYRLVASLDNKTSAYCRSIDGATFTWGESSSLVPPFHYFCRTVIIPEIDSDYAFLSEGRTRSSIYGPVDSNLSYNQWAEQNKDAIAKDMQREKELAAKRRKRARANQ